MEITEIKINPPFIKLEQFLKFTGISETGGHAKILINENKIKVNGTVCLMRGKKLIQGDIVETITDNTAYKVLFNDN